MPITAGQSVSLHDGDALAPLCRELRAWLGSVKRAQDEEIRTYPTPIPRCDAQFNFLYEERARLAQVLDRLDAASRAGHPPGAIMTTLAEIVAAPPFCGSSEELAWRDRLTAAVAQPGSGSALDSRPQTPGRSGITG